MPEAIEALKAKPVNRALAATLKSLPRDSKGENIVPTYTAIVSVVSHLGLAYDRFLDQAMIVVDGEVRRFEDRHYVDIAIQLESLGFGKLPASLKDCVRRCIMDNDFDSAQDWLNGLEWDGVDRVSNLFADYFGVEASEYASAASRYIATAMAGRVIEPGVKADMVPILVGEQGILKTSAVKALAPLVDTFTEIDLSGKGDANLSRQLRGKLIGELGELRGLKTKDAESIKAWITKTHEEWTPKFVEFTRVMPRRCVFLGTTNDQHFLADTTGNRRWLPLAVVGACDPDAISRDRDQIWAQGAAMFKKSGVCWRQAQALAGLVHGDHMIVDEHYVELVQRAIANKPDTFNVPFKGLDIMDAIFGTNMPSTKQNRDAVGAALRHLNFVYGQKWVNGKNSKFWMPPDFKEETN